MPNKTTCTIQQIQTFIVERHAWMDEYIAGLTPVEQIPCTGITLDTSTLSFNGAGSQTLVATVTPENTTDKITWTSDDSGVVSVANGVVTAVGDGTATITATCGTYSATCSVTVVGVDAVYRLSQPTTFNGTSDYIDTGIKLYDTNKDWTILMEVDLSDTDNVNQACVFHCINETGSYLGVNMNFYKSSDNYIIGGSSNGNYRTSIKNTTTKMAIRYVGGVITRIEYNEDGSYKGGTPTATTTFTHDYNLLLGCYQTTDGTKGRFWKGTISQFEVYFSVLPDDAIAEFLGV